eukprot:UN02981
MQSTCSDIYTLLLQNQHELKVIFNMLDYNDNNYLDVKQLAILIGLIVPIQSHRLEKLPSSLSRQITVPHNHHHHNSNDNVHKLPSLTNNNNIITPHLESKLSQLMDEAQTQQFNNNNNTSLLTTTPSITTKNNVNYYILKII